MVSGVVGKNLNKKSNEKMKLIEQNLFPFKQIEKEKIHIESVSIQSNQTKSKMHKQNFDNIDKSILFKGREKNKKREVCLKKLYIQNIFNNILFLPI